MEISGSNLPHYVNRKISCSNFLKKTDYGRVLEENYQLKQRLTNYGEDFNSKKKIKKGFRNPQQNKKKFLPSLLVHTQPGHYLSCASSDRQMFLTAPRQQQAVQFPSHSNVKYNNDDIRLSRSSRAPTRHRQLGTTKALTIQPQLDVSVSKVLYINPTNV